MKLRTVVFWIVASLVLMMPAFYNGYPLVFSDTGTYIHSGMTLQIPMDRPILYGLMIRFFSLGFTLWTVLFFQCLMVAYVLFHLVKFLLPDLRRMGFLMLLTFLSCFTPLGWYCSQIMPDIFTFVAVASIILLMMNERMVLSQKLILAFILVLALNVHFSNFPITILTAIGTLFIARKQALKLELIIPGVAMVCAIIFGMLIKISIPGGNQSAGQMFLLGRCLDTGALQSFLDDKCHKRDYKLCAVKDSLPDNSRTLLFAGHSPLTKFGAWESEPKVYNEVLFGIVTSPKHLGIMIYHGFTSTITQLFQNDIGTGLVSPWYRTAASPPYDQMSKHFKNEMNPYLQSLQNGNLWNEELDLDRLNGIYFWLILISTIIIVLFLSGYTFGESHKKIKLLVYALLISIIANAFITASLANVYARLQARISWLIVFVALILILQHKKIRNTLSALLGSTQDVSP